MQYVNNALTPREKEILLKISEGCSNKEIADSLFVSLSTVKTHTNKIFSKLGANNRVQAIICGKEQNIIPKY